MKISEEFDAIVGFAREEAMRTGSYSIEADHLFLGILRHGSNAAVEALKARGIDAAECKAEIDSQIFHEHSIPYSNEDDIRLGREGSNTVSLAIADAIAEGAGEAGAINLMKAVCKQESSRSSEYLRKHGLCSRDFGKATGDKQKVNMETGMKEMAILLSTFNSNSNKNIVS
ncbi:MAG: hypothetical protein K6F21_01295 [Bacteroidales bacterium]|nr:hypothetical protein [Bacteroidales bacterium]